jgi:hypothetical protein
MSMQPQGPGWWRASDGRWYPPRPSPAYPPQSFGAGPPVPQTKSGGKGWVVVVLAIVAVVLIGGATAAYFVYRSVAGVVGGGGLDCPTAEDISSLVGSSVTGPTSGNMVVASACYYMPKGPDDVIEVIITSGSKIIADDEIASSANEGAAANANMRPIDVGDRGHAWASANKSAAIAVGHNSLVSVEVQGKDFTTIPDKTDAAIAILQKVLN